MQVSEDFFFEMFQRLINDKLALWESEHPQRYYQIFACQPGTAVHLQITADIRVTATLYSECHEPFTVFLKTKSFTNLNLRASLELLRAPAILNSNFKVSDEIINSLMCALSDPNNSARHLVSALEKLQQNGAAL